MTATAQTVAERPYDGRLVQALLFQRDVRGKDIRDARTLEAAAGAAETPDAYSPWTLRQLFRMHRRTRLAG